VEVKGRCREKEDEDDAASPARFLREAEPRVKEEPEAGEIGEDGCREDSLRAPGPAREAAALTMSS